MAAGGRVLLLRPSPALAGDILIAALVDALPELAEPLLGEASRIFSELSLSFETATSHHIRGTRLFIHDRQGRVVGAHPSEEAEKSPLDRKIRTYGELTEFIRSAGLSPRVEQVALRGAELLARAEAEVHGKAGPEEIHFHELAALDTALDLILFPLALELAGIERVFSSALTMPQGELAMAHGPMPLPAPATARILSRIGAQVRGGEIEFESVTPTGAALLGAVGAEFDSSPALSLEAVGFGLGHLDPGRPNLLMAMVGTAAGELSARGLIRDQVGLVETVIDDLSPEDLPPVVEELYRAGALEVYWTAASVAGGRPGIALSLIVPPDRLEPLAKLVLTLTPTLGVRVELKERLTLPRETVEVEVEGCPVKVKVAKLGDELFKAKPEHRDLVELSKRLSLPLHQVRRLVMEALRNLPG